MVEEVHSAGTATGSGGGGESGGGRSEGPIAAAPARNVPGDCSALNTEKKASTEKKANPLGEEFAAAQAAVAAANAGFRLLAPLGEGGYGIVAHARSTEGKDVAVKCLKLGPDHSSKHIEREILHHMKLLHAHVVRLRQVFAARPYLCIVMEMVPGGNLLQYINSHRGLGEDEARYIFQQLVLAMDYCHRMGVMNRDIKPQNTLLVRVPGKPPMVKLCDFGYAKSLEDSAPTTRAGTMHYVAPEVLTNAPRCAYNGMKADVFSCGVLLYVTLFCTFPFADSGGALGGNEVEQMRRMLRRMAGGEFSFPRNKPVSAECQDLLRRMLAADHGKRYSVADIKKHPWFLKHLLPGTLEYNDQVLAMARQMPQSKQEVHRVIKQSMAVPLASQGSGQGGDSAQFEEEDRYMDEMEDYM